MVIKRECVIKSLKSDYKVIGPIAGVILALVIFVYLVSIYKDVFTAFNVYIILEIFSMIPISCAIVLYGSSTPEERASLKSTGNTIFLIILNSLIMGVIACVYHAMSCNPVLGTCKYPDIVLLTVIFLAFNALIVCPLAIAYARCKE